MSSKNTTVTIKLLCKQTASRYKFNGNYISAYL